MIKKLLPVVWVAALLAIPVVDAQAQEGDIVAVATEAGNLAADAMLLS